MIHCPYCRSLTGSPEVCDLDGDEGDWVLLYFRANRYDFDNVWCTNCKKRFRVLIDFSYEPMPYPDDLANCEYVEDFDEDDEL